MSSTQSLRDLLLEPLSGQDIQIRRLYGRTIAVARDLGLQIDRTKRLYGDLRREMGEHFRR
jgi:hypothetical protein